MIDLLNGNPVIYVLSSSMKLPFYNNNYKAINQFEDDSVRLTNIILRLTMVAWIIGKPSCYKLWLSERVYPIVPSIHLGFEAPSWMHLFLFIAGLMLMLFLLLFPRKQLFLYLLLIVELLICLLDETRWQAWEYQYLLMVAIFITNWRNINRIIGLLAVLLACTYIYSGIAKLNTQFVTVFWQINVLHTLLHLPMHITRNLSVHRMGYALPITELIGGALFLIKRFRKLGVVLLILMHLFNLAVLGPFTLNYNSSVWSWNVVMIAYLYLIGFKLDKVQLNTIITKKSTLNLPMIVLIVVMPVFNFIDLWPHFLSFSLYSYKAKQLMITVNENTTAAKELNPYFEIKSVEDSLNTRHIILHNWAMKEMNTPPFPEEGYYKKMKVAFMNKYPDVGARFYISQSQNTAFKEMK